MIADRESHEECGARKTRLRLSATASEAGGFVGRDNPRFHAASFTLIEMLAAAAIIAILAALLLPAMRRAKERAQIMVCMNNLRQIGACLTLYVGEYEGCAPPDRWAFAGSGWPGTLTLSSFRRYGFGPVYGGGLIKDPQVFYCPANRWRKYPANFPSLWNSSTEITATYTYGLEGYGGQKLLSIVSQKQGLGRRRVVIGLDTARAGSWENPEGRVAHHGANFLFADGSVQFITWPTAPLPYPGDNNYLQDNLKAYVELQ